MATITIEREKQAALDSIRSSEAALRECVNKLHNIPELEVPASLGNIAEVDWVREQLNGRIALVKSDKSLTSEERETRLAPWRAIKAKAERAVNKIAFILNDLQPLEWLPDEDGLNFHLDQSQVEQVATNKATKQVPPLAEKHWQLITAMRLAVEELRQFEHKYNLKDATLYQLSQLTQERLFELWFSGDIILKDYVVAGRKFIHPKTQQIFY